MDTLIRQDTRTGLFFGFVIDKPAVCAQADSYEEVEIKLESHLLRYNLYMGTL